MRAAIQIADAMKKHGVTKTQLAKMMGRRPSEITKWLSGSQNFTMDTLTELSYYLKEKITGESAVVEKTIISVSYNPQIEQEFPEFISSARISYRKRWSDPKPIHGLISNQTVS